MKPHLRKKFTNIALHFSKIGSCMTWNPELLSEYTVQEPSFRGHVFGQGRQYLLSPPGLWNRSRKDFQPEESESWKILTTPGRPFAHQLWLFVPQTYVSVTLGNLGSLTLQQEMIMAIQTGGSALICIPSLRSHSRSATSLRAHHATYTLWMQPFGSCITEISICSFWLALSLLRDVG